VLTLDGAPTVTPFSIRPDEKGTFWLGAESAEIESNLGQRAKKENLLNHVFITRWSRAADVPTWVIDVPKAGRYKVEMSYGAAGASVGTAFTLSAGDASVAGTVERSKSGDLVFHTHPIGTLTLQAGEQTLKLKAETRGDAAMNLEGVKLTRLE
jgi:hypothetical protein